MSTNPDDIRLAPELRRRIAGIADESGKDWSDVLYELVDSAEAVIGIERGLESSRKGEGLPAEEVHADLRKKYKLT